MYNYIESTGTITADTADLQTEVQGEFVTAFGTGLNLNDNTPQGVMITDETLARASVLQNNVNVANQINRNLSSGIFLDALGGLMGVQRVAATYSTVVVNVTGVPGTVLPALTSVVADINQNEWALTADITLDVSGNGSGSFQAIIAGPIAALANTLTQIVNGIVGWETATNPADAVLGTAVQSDQSYRGFQNLTLGNYGTSMTEAIISALYLTAGVTSVSFLENITNTSQVISGVTMAPNSIYACVAGGTALAVATTLYAKKSGGCAYSNGAAVPVSQVVVDPVSGQSITVLYDTPNVIPILVQVQVRANTAVVDPVAAIKQAILDYAAGLLGSPGFQIGATVSVFELSGAINQEVPNLFVSSVTISKASPIDFSNPLIPSAIYEQPSISAGNITVTLI